MKKTIAKPINWQDFESLCKKLWGEIWDCPHIKKNGRAGQAQHGVDVYGIPANKHNYWGIQCKGKDDYSKAELTTKEIDDEIEKAKTFDPKLEYFIFATSANKDAKIEQYVRVKNIELINQGFFSLEIYSWEDITDLIEENRDTYNWYVRSISYKTNFNIEVSLNDETEELKLEPIYEKNIVKVQRKREGGTFYGHIANNKNIIDAVASLHMPVIPVVVGHAQLLNYVETTDFSYVKIKVDLFNTGNVALEYYKLILNFNLEDIEIEETNIAHKGMLTPIINFGKTNYYIDKNSVTYSHNSNRPILVPEDGRQFEFFIKLPSIKKTFNIDYQFLSKEFNHTGSIVCCVEPIFEESRIIREPNEGESEREFENIIPKISSKGH